MRRTVLLILAAVALAAPVRADHLGPCDGDVGGADGTPRVSSGTILSVADAYYVDVRSVADVDGPASVWLYQEVNGEPFLQRGVGAEVPEPWATVRTVVASGDDGCLESAYPDALLI